MKSDRNEAITKNDQFLIIYSGRGVWGGGYEVLLRNAQIRILQHFVIRVGRREQALFQRADTISMRGCQAEPELEILLATLARCTCTTTRQRINKPDSALSARFSPGREKKTRV